MTKSILTGLLFAVVFGAEASVGGVEIHAAAGAGEAQWFETKVAMPDGKSLYTFGAAPAEGKKFPIIVSRSPYVKPERVDVAGWAAGQKLFTGRGYAHIHQHCRGCGMSEGDWVPYLAERNDGLELLEFVRKLPWYNGEIYLMGGSYGASVHWAYLDTDPPDVKGAALFVQDVNRYNVTHRNGFFKTALHGGWFIKDTRKRILRSSATRT